MQLVDQSASELSLHGREWRGPEVQLLQTTSQCRKESTTDSNDTLSQSCPQQPAHKVGPCVVHTNTGPLVDQIRL